MVRSVRALGHAEDSLSGMNLEFVDLGKVAPTLEPAICSKSSSALRPDSPDLLCVDVPYITKAAEAPTRLFRSPVFVFGSS